MSATLQLIRRASVEFVDSLVSQHNTIYGCDPEPAQRIIDDALNTLLKQLETTELVGPANREASQMLWWIAGPILKSGWLQTRAREKPAGYAGDYLLLERIAEHWESADRLGRCFDHYFQKQSAPAAVRNRMQYMADLMVNRAIDKGSPITVASIGAGSAREIAWAASRLAQCQMRIGKVVLLDIDERALCRAASLLADHLPSDSIVVRRENLNRFHRKPAAMSQLEGSDVIYCLGLFDYLPDDVAASMLQSCWRALAPRGCVTAFNFAAMHTTRSYMEWVGNWYLNYRTADELLAIARQAELPESVEVDREPLGVNLFLKADKLSVGI